MKDTLKSRTNQRAITDRLLTTLPNPVREINFKACTLLILTDKLFDQPEEVNDEYVTNFEDCVQTLSCSL